jgi:chromosome partitioning protein
MKPMQTVAVICEKGGVGKTTIALELAVSSMLKGRLAAVLDIDPQASASKWTDRRGLETPWVVPTHATRLSASLKDAQEHGVELVVIDTPPHSDSSALSAARFADLVLIPVEPHVFALETVDKAADLIKMAGGPPTFFLINKAPVQGTESTSAIEHIVAQGFNVCPVILYQRAAHRHASNLGKSTAEVDAESKAALEAQELFNFVTLTLKKIERKKSHAKV